MSQRLAKLESCVSKTFGGFLLKMEPSSEVFSWGQPVLRRVPSLRVSDVNGSTMWNFSELILFPSTTWTNKGSLSNKSCERPQWNIQHINSLKKCKPCNFVSRQKTKDSNSTVMLCLSSVVSGLNDAFL